MAKTDPTVLTKRQATTARTAIQSGLLIKRLQQHALADQEIMTPSQIQAAKILLAKAVPDLQSVEHTGEGGGPVQVAFNVKLGG
jgi:hypothetical protein